MSTPIDTPFSVEENPAPVPLKHSTETAYMFILGLVICLAGIAAALLPNLPAGMKYWAILLIVSVLYPLVLSRTFKSNRADYEFRMLHWFPAGIFILWFVLQLVAPRLEFLRILTLGFFFLWSLPLVALGIAFIIIFAIHVLRRSRLRVTTLAIVLALFTAGALYAEASNVNPRLQAALFPKNLPLLEPIRLAFSNLQASLGLTSGSAGLLTMNDASSAGSMDSASAARSVASVSSSSIKNSAVAIGSSSLPPIIGDKKPGRLTQSGPEDIAVLATTLLAAYFGLLHARARKRV